MEPLKDYYIKPNKGNGLIYYYKFENGKGYVGQTTGLLTTRHHRHVMGKAPVDESIRKSEYELYLLCETKIEMLNE